MTVDSANRMRFVKTSTAVLSMLAGAALIWCGTACAEEKLPLILVSPADWQVSQRQTAEQGQIRLAGRKTADIDVEWRLTGKPLHGTLNDAWTALPQRDAATDFSADIAVPAGGWYRLQVRAIHEDKTVAETNVEHVGVGEVFIVAGQSNSANYGSEKQQPKSGMVASFDGKTWRVADDPQPGAGGTGGSFIPAFGDTMADRFHVPIGIVSIGVGSTSVREWLPKGEEVNRLTTTGRGLDEISPGHWQAKGELFDKLKSRLDAQGPHGCRAILWHQGESDAGQARGGAPADRQISGDDYSRYMKTLVEASRQSAGWQVPWFTAQATYHSERDPADDEFRAAQKSLWESKLTLPGPDTDALGAEFRQGVHFNGRGLQQHGKLWAEKVGAWLDTQLRGN
jgi:Carbohydrate esterase, sialic acid-specific acetylesterase